MPKRCTLGHRMALDALRKRLPALYAARDAASRYDADGIHDMRVASRRLRSVLVAHKTQLKQKASDELLNRFKAITGGLGVARELDVTCALLEKKRSKMKGAPRTAATQVLGALRALRKSETQSVDAGVHLAAEERIEAAVRQLESESGKCKHCYLASAEEALEKRLALLDKRYALWQKTHSEEELHQVRIAFKHLRYHAEVFQPLYGQPMEDFIKKLKSAQEHLGAWNDARVLRDYVERLAHDLNGKASEGVAQLHSELDREADGLLDAFEASAEDLFNEESHARIRDLFADPSHTCCDRKKDE
ncbi:MAG: CHAD domain-containing protein [Candidatus Hydrogenedentes bacterium]|nr:CHAD domain-containing protein [Candidatus Hydrogenedentota bacterium]